MKKIKNTIDKLPHSSYLELKKTNLLIAMSFDKIPNELRMLIFQHLHFIYEDNAGKIQRCWQKFKNKQTVIHDMWDLFEVEDSGAWGQGNFNNEPHLIIPHTANLIKFTARILSTKQIVDNEITRIWRLRTHEIQYSLYLEQYTGGPLAEIFDIIEENNIKLARKFGWNLRELNGYEY